MSPRKRGAAIAGAVVLIVGVSGIAFAYWTSTGTGTGQATTGASVAFVITSDAPVGTISPGSAGQTVDFSVSNPGGGTLNLSQVTVQMASSNGTPWVPTGGCPIADYSATITTAPATGALAAGASRDGTVTVTLANTGANQDACQGQTVPLYFVAS